MRAVHVQPPGQDTAVPEFITAKGAEIEDIKGGVTSGVFFQDLCEYGKGLMVVIRIGNTLAGSKLQRLLQCAKSPNTVL